MGLEVTIFFTFYGLEIIKKGGAGGLKISPIGHPAMPIPVPMPSLAASLPGLEAMATAMMRSRFKKNGVAVIGQLFGMAMDTMGVKQSDIIDGVEIGGAATWLDAAAGARTNLFV